MPWGEFPLSKVGTKVADRSTRQYPIRFYNAVRHRHERSEWPLPHPTSDNLCLATIQAYTHTFKTKSSTSLYVFA